MGWTIHSDILAEKGAQCKPTQACRLTFASNAEMSPYLLSEAEVHEKFIKNGASQGKTFMFILICEKSAQAVHLIYFAYI